MLQQHRMHILIALMLVTLPLQSLAVFKSLRYVIAAVSALAAVSNARVEYPYICKTIPLNSSTTQTIYTTGTIAIPEKDKCFARVGMRCICQNGCSYEIMYPHAIHEECHESAKSNLEAYFYPGSSMNDQDLLEIIAAFSCNKEND